MNASTSSAGVSPLVIVTVAPVSSLSSTSVTARAPSTTIAPPPSVKISGPVVAVSLGASLTAVTVIATVAVAVPPRPSLTEKVKLSGPA